MPYTSRKRPMTSAMHRRTVTSGDVAIILRGSDTVVRSLTYFSGAIILVKALLPFFETPNLNTILKNFRSSDEVSGSKKHFRKTILFIA